jgi:hypothetical protein
MDCGYAGNPKEIEETTGFIGIIIVIATVILGSSDFGWFALAVILLGLLFMILRLGFRIPRISTRKACPRCDSLNITKY